MHQWSRAPMNSNKVHVLKLSDIRGWSMLCEDAGTAYVQCFIYLFICLFRSQQENSQISAKTPAPYTFSIYLFIYFAQNKRTIKFQFQISFVQRNFVP